MNITENNSLNELAEKTLRVFGGNVNNEVDVNISITGAPIVELVKKIMTIAIKSEASDIHFEPHEKNMSIRMRIDGILQYIITLPLLLHAPMISRLKIISGMDTVEQRKPQDGSMSYKYDGRMIDTRISIIPSIYGEKLVLRLLNTLGRCLKVDELALSKKNRKIFEHLINRPSGLILNTGPVNSGKTTTLYAALNKLATVEKNIVTIEDPVEYKLMNVTQMQVNEKIGLTFEVGLRTVLRQDPNIILIGEIRDECTAAIATRAALTGHLVFSTLHTANAVNAIFRMLDMQVKSYLLAEVLAGCISQRLLRCICEHCRTNYIPDENSLQKKFMQKYAIKSAFYGKGCEECNNTGYAGRIAVQEIFVVNANMRKAIAAKANSVVVKNIALENGMQPLLSDAIAKITEGKTTISEVMRVINEDDYL